MNKTNHINFRILNLENFQSNIYAVDFEFDADTTFKFNIIITHRVNIDENLIVVTPIIDIITNDDVIVVGKFSASIVYEFDKLSQFLIEKEIKLPPDVLFSINSIAISTIRGMMFATFKGTALHNAILPVVDPKSLTANY